MRIIANSNDEKNMDVGITITITITRYDEDGHVLVNMVNLNGIERERDSRDHMTTVRRLQPLSLRHVSNTGLTRSCYLNFFLFESIIIILFV